MKKILALLLAVLMVVGMFTACAKKAEEPAAAPKAEEPAKEPAAEEPAAEEPAAEEPAGEGNDKFAGQTLKIAAQDGGYGYEFWERAGEAFKKYYPGIEIEVQADPKIGDVIRPQLIAGEFPDLYSLNWSDIMYKTLIESKQVENLNELYDMPLFGSDDPTPLRELMPDGVLELATIAPFADDPTFVAAAPESFDFSGMYYNKTLFEKNGWELPETWDDFFALGDKAKEQGIALFTYPGMYPSYNETIIWPAVAAVAGPEAVQDIRNYKEGSIIDNPDVMYVFEQFEKIATGGYLMEGTVALNHTQSQSEFMLDKALFIPNGSWLPNEMADAPRTEGFEFSVTLAPVKNKGDQPWVRCSSNGPIIPSKAEHKELAKEFIRFMYTDECVRIFAESTVMVPVKRITEIAGDLMTSAQMTALGLGDRAKAQSFEFAPAENTKIVIYDECYQPISDVMNCKMTAQQWAESVEAAMAAIRAGE